jgi:hypothetical protein
MIVLPQKLPFFLMDVEEHTLVKKTTIDLIEGMGTFSYKNDNQTISSTDWHLSPSHPRPYYEPIKHILQGVCAYITKKMEYEYPLNIQNYWYQKYNQGDSHPWHVHQNSNFSSVYYLNLPEGCSKTTFKILDEEFSIDVKEGQILSFPGIAMHCSKPNQSKDPKIIISFNI